MELLDESQFAAFLKANRLVLVDFFAPWCGPCRAFEPALQALAEDFTDRVAVAKVNIDESTALAEAYAVRAVPTLIIFRDGEVVESLTGARTREDLSKRLSQLLP
jgi:thioredoxin 1